ncbi:MAG TPA: hemerythrin domain-containing protein [Ramlibacter sp.]|uniref:hemerythrin domain-containing protein n=1 Tax=Ramlibacter sp. TaxID=1917967 RepID=UPI002BB46E13|nr:hemerythrin domain-containing protein [Ramlibacter sp.]HVZ42293.1 hemerythrin domain-containing protein [Ramlibacter sp.]
MDIFEALIASHEVQRGLARQLLASVGEPKERERIFGELRTEMAAHETAEERAFYVPLFEHDETVDAARHGVSEHHEMDEMTECLDKRDEGSAEWLEEMGKLLHKLQHHLDEEEEKFFPEAKKVLGKDQQEALGALYREEHDRLQAAQESGDGKVMG